MVIGITGTIGAGKGEKRILGALQDLARYFLKKIPTRCTVPVRNSCRIFKGEKRICSLFKLRCVTAYLERTELTR